MGTATQDWANQARALRSQARQVVLGAQAMSLQAQANDLTGAITSAVGSASPTLANSNMPTQTAIDLVAIFGAFEAWLAEPVSNAPGAPSRLLALFKEEA